MKNSLQEIDVAVIDHPGHGGQNIHMWIFCEVDCELNNLSCLFISHPLIAIALGLYCIAFSNLILQTLPNAAIISALHDGETAELMT